MKIVILSNQSDFNKEQQYSLSKLGEVGYLKSRDKHSLNTLLQATKGADILGVTPDTLGGFEKAKPVLTEILKSLPKLKGIATDTTDTSWIDLDYCKKNNIIVSSIPKSNQRETIAEHTFALLLCVAKRIIEIDRITQKGQYELREGKLLKGKTIGIIGLGSIGSRVAEIANGFDMNVIAYNHSPKKQQNVIMKSLDAVLSESNMLSIHVPFNQKNNKMIGCKEIDKMKDEVIIINTADRNLIDEQAMADSLKSGKVFGYGYEGEDLINTPLAGINTAIAIQSFGWYTTEALQELFKTWIQNIKSIAQNKPQNVVL